MCMRAKSLQSFLTLGNPVGCSPPGSSVHGILQARITGVDCHFLLQGIVPTQGLNPSLLHLLHWQAGSLLLAPSGKPLIFSQVCLNIRDFKWKSPRPSSSPFPVWSPILGKQPRFESAVAPSATFPSASKLEAHRSACIPVFSSLFIQPERGFSPVIIL